jgi:hypothetical protein
MLIKMRSALGATNIGVPPMPRRAQLWSEQLSA